MLKHLHRRHDEVDDVDRTDTESVERDRLQADRELERRADDDRTLITRDRHADDPTLVTDDRATDDHMLVIDDDAVVRRPQPAVVESVDELPPPPHDVGVRVEQIVTETTFSPGQVVIMLAGAVTLALGIAAMVEGGLGGSMTEPVVEVFDFNHTPALGLIEVGAGIVLMLTGLSAVLRPLAGLFGALVVAAGVVVLAEIDWVQDKLAAEQGFGWVPIAIGGVVLLAAFALPKTSRRRVTVVR